MAKLQLNVQSREITGKKVGNLREQGVIPAVMYGPGYEPASIRINYSEFLKLFEEAGNSSVVTATIDGKEQADVIIKEVTQDAVTGFITHVDLYKFKAGEKLEAVIALNFINEPPTVKELGATLVKNRDEVAVRCLPGDLVSELDVDLSALKTIDDSIKIKDLPLSDGMEPLDDVETIIAITTIEEVKEEEPVAAVDLESIPTVGGGKKTEEDDANEEESK